LTAIVVSKDCAGVASGVVSLDFVSKFCSFVVEVYLDVCETNVHCEDLHFGPGSCRVDQNVRWEYCQSSIAVVSRESGEIVPSCGSEV